MTYPVRIGTGLTVNPMASYTYLSYDGGHENRFDFGAQLRKSMGRAGAPPSFWIGAEGAYAFLKDEFEGGSEDYDGWSLTALVGVPLVQNKLNPHIVGGAGISGYGSGTGKNVRLGVSVTPF